MTGAITVIVPISPIPSHPSTGILETTVDSVRHHLPDAEVFALFDGVRHEQADRQADYDEHIRRALWLADHKWGATLPFLFEEHRHQIGMIREVLDKIETPLLAFIESDCPLVTDRVIDWTSVCEFILGGESNLVRLHHEAEIPHDHRSMMHGVDGQFIRTSQFSARPHVASVAYYRAAMKYFSPNARCFAEDVLHGVVANAYLRDGMLGWNMHRMHIYNPGGSTKFSYTVDGRGDADKFDDTQVF